MIFYCNVDVLERNIIISVVRRYQREDKNKKSNGPIGLHLKALEKDIGTPFTAWQKVYGIGKKTSVYDWRSMVGKEKKKQLVNQLPEKFTEVLNPDTCDTVKKIWQVC